MKNLDALIPKSHSISNILSLFGSIKKIVYGLIFQWVIFNMGTCV